MGENKSFCGKVAPSLWSCQDDDAPMADGFLLTWEPVRLSADRVEFDSTCLGAEVEVQDGWTVTHLDSTTQIKGEGDLRVTVAQGRYRLLEAECSARGYQSSIFVRASSKWLPMWRNAKTSGRSDPASSGTVFEWHRMLMGS